MEIPVNHGDKRLKSILDYIDFIVDLLRRGGNIYIHCITGVTRSIFLAAILQSQLQCEPVETAMLRIMKLRATDVYHPRANPRGRSGRKNDKHSDQRTETFQEQQWVKEACEAPVYPLPANGMYMAAKDLSSTLRMVHACPSEGHPLCYMKKKDRTMKGACESADDEAGAMVHLGSHLCRECMLRLDLLSVSRLHAAGFSVQMDWR